MDISSSTLAAEDKTGRKGIVVESPVVTQRPRKIMGQTRLD